MEPYYVCDCPTCKQPKYSKAKRFPSGITLKHMQEWECYSCSKSASKNPSYGKEKSIDWINKVSTSLKGKNVWSRNRKLNEVHKNRISDGLIKSDELKKRKADGYLISLGMKNGLAHGLTRHEYEQLITDKKRYYNEVHKITKRQPIELLEYYDKRGKAKKGSDNYQLDHIIPIAEGFQNNIDPYIIGDISNLRFIPWKENILRSKQNKLN